MPIRRLVTLGALVTFTSLIAGSLESQDMGGGTELRALVFLTIAGTVGLAGLTARPLATLLHLRLPGRDRVAILGAEGLGLRLAGELRQAGVDVVFLDSDPKRCHQAEEAGFSVVFGDALQERTLLRAQMELVGSAIGLTASDHLNSLFVGQAKDLFAVPNGYVAVRSLDGQETPEYVQRHKGEVLFEGPHDVERWDVRVRHGEVAIEHFVFHGVEATEADRNEGAAPKAGERFVMLAVKREKDIVPMTLGYQLRDGDVASVAIHVPERDDAYRLLREMGWQEAGRET